MIKALIFDFDGLVVDTEICVFRAWQEIYEEYGQELQFSDWAKCIGAGDQEFHPLNNLEKLMGQPLDRDAIRKKEHHRIYELVEKESILPGVKDYIDKAKEIGLKMAVASSSPHVWVDTHLERLGLFDFFDTIRCKDDVKSPKPEPDLFNLALSDLDVEPKEAIVFEDSPNGILAANRAGIFCVAIPNSLTRQLSTDHANLHLKTLADMPLEELLNKVNNG